MGKQTSHEHPNRLLYKVQQVALLASLIASLFASVMLIVVALLLSTPLFVIMSLLVLLLSAPLLMALVNTPPVTITDEGLILQPFIGNERHIPWQAIEHIEAYPLLPQANQEILKQYLIGRKKYRPAEGIMLIVPSLPLPYRIAGLLTGTGGMPLIAFTNRTHQDYETLTHRIMHYASHAIHDNSLINEE